LLREKKVKKRKQLKAPIAQFVAIIVLSISVFLMVDFGRRAAANYRIQREADNLTMEVEAAREYRDKLLAQRTYAASNLYVEEIARNQLKWSKPGETLVIVIPIESQPESKGNITSGGTRLPGATTPQQAWFKLFLEPRLEARDAS
jgi:cell division protein FtsB